MVIVDLGFEGRLSYKQTLVKTLWLKYTYIYCSFGQSFRYSAFVIGNIAIELSQQYTFLSQEQIKKCESTF